jgi:hypothetical protein
MPIYRKQDSKGYYYQYGSNGKKYYYKVGNPNSRAIAKGKAVRQSVAIHASEGRQRKRKGGLMKATRNHPRLLGGVMDVKSFIKRKIRNFTKEDFDRNFKDFNEELISLGLKPYSWNSKLTPEIKKDIKRYLFDQL